MQVSLNSPKYAAGFTLIELMIVVAILGVLAAFAFPAYQRHVISTNRTDVQAELVQIGQRIQNYKIVNGDYTGMSLSSPAIYGASVFPKTGKPLYNIVMASNQRSGLITDWTLQATPVATSIQKDDGIVQLNDIGQRCWVKGQTTCTLSANSNWSEN